jgi:hypothetical protein
MTSALTSQSEYTSRCLLGSAGNLMNTGVTLIDRGTIGATAAQRGVLSLSIGNTVVDNAPSQPNPSRYPGAAGAVRLGGSNVLLKEQVVRSWSALAGELKPGATPQGTPPTSTN